jgi:NADH-quinone oxidoreductase subunit N
VAVDGRDRVLFGGAYVVDDFSLVLKAMFLLVGYVVLLMSTNYIAEGDYYEGEFSFLLLSSLLGMVVISSARDLITIFVALELLSIPAYLLAGWRKRDLKSNEASLKYYLLGVLASSIMLYGMSLIFGISGSTLLVDIGRVVGGSVSSEPVVTLGIFFVVVGFAFKVSAVPFHFWAPDTYEGAPTPVTAFLSVASKAAGFVALLQLVFIGFFGRSDVWGPMFWVLAAVTMTVGNLIALRQTNIVRLLAYSSIAQAGYMLVPFAVAGDNLAASSNAIEAVVVYLMVYAAMNLGAFAIVMAVARKTGSGEIASYGGLFQYAPGLAVTMTLFLFSLAGIPPLAGAWAKIFVFRSVLDAGTSWAVALGVIAGVNSVIALFYYAAIAKEMWMNPVPDEDRTPIRVPPALGVALGLTAAVVVAVGVYPELFAHFGDLATFSGVG